MLEQGIRCLILLSTVVVLSPFAHAKQSSSGHLKYCIPVAKVDLNPLREIKDGKDLAYLLLMRSFISTDSSEPGILESFEFSPDGTSFTGRLANGLRWSDGTLVSPKEAAEGIVAALPFRTLGERVKSKPELIRVIDSRSFRITFDSTIENLTGVVREALSSNSRHNRFWLAKKSKNGEFDVLAKFPFFSSSSGGSIEFNGARIRLASDSDCKDPDFSIFPEAMTSSPSNLIVRRSQFASAITVQPNTKRLNIGERTELISWSRNAFVNQPLESGITSVDSFFLQGEAGYSSEAKWDVSAPSKRLQTRTFTVGFEIPVIKTVLEARAIADGVKLSFTRLPLKDGSVDVQVLSSGIANGRHLILQDALKWAFVSEFLLKAPKTRASLKVIADKSASTLPPDVSTLQAFEKNAIEEKALAPVARKFPIAYSKRGLGTCLSWTATGELTFLKESSCGGNP